MVYSDLPATRGLYVPSTPGHYVIQVVHSQMTRIIRCFPNRAEAQRFADNLSYRSVDTAIISH